MKITALVVDDEPLDRELLSHLIAHYCHSIEVVAEANSVQEAVRYIKTHHPQVVFLDINMPQEGGFSLLQYFENRDFHIVFTTGSGDHGIRAIKADAVDYLLKPIDVDELILTEKKLLKICPVPPGKAAGLRVFNNGDHLIVTPKDIVCLEAEGSYVKVHLASARTVLLSKNLKQVMMEVSDPALKRVHRSYVVNVDHIVRYHVTGNELTLYLTNEVIARASRKYKAQLKGSVL